MEIFQRFNQDQGMTVVIVTHEADIAQYSKRAVCSATAASTGLPGGESPQRRRGPCQPARTR